MAALETGRRPRPDYRIQLSARQQRGNGVVRASILHKDVGSQVQTDLFDAARVFVTASDPGDVSRTDSVILLKDHTDPDIRREPIFRHADAATLEVGRRFDPVGADIDRGVPKGAGWEHR